MVTRARSPINLDQPVHLYVGNLLLIHRIFRPTLYNGLTSGR